MALRGTSSSNSDVNLHNADGTTGRKPASDSGTINLSVEDRAVLDAVLAKLDMPLSTLATSLESITINVGTTVGLNDTTNTQVDPATKPEQVLQTARLISLDGKDFATQATLAALNAKIPASPATDRVTAAAPFSMQLSDGVSFYKATTPTDTQPISAAVLPLPAGASTAAAQATSNASLASIDGKLTAPLSANITDSVVRELGRVLASDTLHASESYVTTDVDASTRPTNGDMVVRHFTSHTIAIVNSGANNARITVQGSVDNGVNFDVAISTNTLLSSANTMIVSEDRALTHIRILARANTAGNQTTIQTRGYSTGT